MHTLTTLNYTSCSNRTFRSVRRRPGVPRSSASGPPERGWLLTELKLNEEKTEFMLIGTPQRLSKVRTDSLLVAGTFVSSVSEAKNLGVWFDSKFQFQTHINKTCQSAFYYIYNIRRTRKFLSFEAAKTLVQALVISFLDYCNSVLYGIPAIHTNKLSIQSIYKTRPRDFSQAPHATHTSLQSW